MLLRACLCAAVLLVAVGCGKKKEEDSPDDSRTEADKAKEKLRDDIKGLVRGNGKPAPDTPDDPGPKVETKAAGPNEWSQVGDVRVRVTKAAVKKVPLTVTTGLSDRKEETKEPELMLWLEIENTSKVKKFDYKRWGNSLSSPRASATDEHGNKYRPKIHDGGYGKYVEGTFKFGSANLRPGEKPIADILCFDRPVDAATELVIVLKPLVEEEKGEFRFKIPASAWK